MLTPPYHFSVVAAPLQVPVASTSALKLDSPVHDLADEILYRGAIPAVRNFSFLRQKKLKTVVCIRDAPLDGHDERTIFFRTVGADVRWIKASPMTEEKLGLGRTEVSEVLKLMLDRSRYPLYIADLDGRSHTTLVVACLRKLQGWHMTSIVDEICRFEPDHEDYSLVPFITSYLSSTDSSFSLPPPPYPAWLWPSPPVPVNPLSRHATREVKDRERSGSANAVISANTLLPFPHPLQARKHPTMKLVYPQMSTSSNASPMLSPASTNMLSRVPTRVERAMMQGEENRTSPSLVGTAASIVAGLSGAAVGGSDFNESTMPAEAAKQARNVNFIPRSASPERFSRHTTISSKELTDPSSMSEEEEAQDRMELDNQGQYAVSDEEEDDHDDEDSDEEDEERELEPTSEYIDALDLAGYA